MARKDKPYLPLYVQDFLTDERLMECSASATGIYIRIMCVMHKSDTYGTILLQQKDKQNEQQINNFATKLAKHLPYSLLEICAGLTELISEKVLKIEGDLLVQKRMFEDGELSETRSKSGSKGGKTTKKRMKNFAVANTAANIAAKQVANADIDNDIEIDTVLTVEFTNLSIESDAQKFYNLLVPEMISLWKEEFPLYHFDEILDSHACLRIAYKIAGIKKWKKAEVIKEKKMECLEQWQKIIFVVKKDNWYSKLTLDSIAGDKIWQKIMNSTTTANGTLTPHELDRQKQLKQYTSGK